MTTSLYQRSALWRLIVTVIPDVEIGAFGLWLHDNGVFVTWRNVVKWEWKATP